MIPKSDARQGVSTAIGYVRVSEGCHDAENVVVAQKEEIVQFADAAGQQVSGWYVDEGGGTVVGPVLQELLAAVKAGNPGFGTVITSSWSRLSRNVAEFHFLRSMFSEAGIRLLSVSEPEPSDSTPAERFAEGLIKIIKDFERDARREDRRKRHGPLPQSE